ncbi:hypothetical protein RchiOBHm_Chr7g0209521 [Rosa chinensis]|uniref:Uncharacterized protein n=1 Tax=Rosa chinensis TaxID=74649 RepID=A0A2P6PA13_ROSCH|nr:hypothetical protein RchiOBHm_Chr7g0209521 [Rosa chinensis]
MLSVTELQLRSSDPSSTQTELQLELGTTAARTSDAGLPVAKENHRRRHRI